MISILQPFVLNRVTRREATVVNLENAGECIVFVIGWFHREEISGVRLVGGAKTAKNASRTRDA